MKKLISISLALILAAGISACSTNSVKLDPKNPVKINVWTYYNGAQQETFDKLVSEFNQGEGLTKGIVVEHTSQGGIYELADELFAAVKGNSGAQEVPELAMTYPETALAVQSIDMLATLDSYFTKEELSAYIPEFIEEGRLAKDGPIYIMPVAKSTEILAVNKTDWDDFAAKTQTSEEELSTIEGITAVAEKYFNWTDELTSDIKDDGKAFFGRDALDNYFIVGSAQLGKEIFPVDGNKDDVQVDKETTRVLWDNYYLPYVKGYFIAEGKFSSDDMKTGKIIAYVGSSSSTGYFPDKVTLSDDSSYPIEAMMLPAPVFKDAKKQYSVQQGAGFCMLKSSPEKQFACGEFLKWFTAEEQNLNFALGSSYMPVTIAANNQNKIETAVGREEIQANAMVTAAKMMSRGELYISKPFAGMGDIRAFIKISLLDRAKADRKAIVDKLQQGTELEKALESYVSDESFEAWYGSFSGEIMSFLK